MTLPDDADPTITVRVNEVEISDGQRTKFPHEGVVFLVGPNNAGKSQLLKDIYGHARDLHGYVGKVATTVEFEKVATGDIARWVDRHVPQIVKDGSTRYRVAGWADVPSADIVTQWNQVGLNVLVRLFVFHADGTSRLTAGDSQQSIDFAKDIPSHPVHRAYIDGGLEQELDKKSREAFGLGVTVDRYGGSTISLRLGDRPQFVHAEGRPSAGYLEALKRLPQLEQQGDGVRSYLGLLLHMLAGEHQVILIDEPEAFLHPPQARRLGRILAEQGRTLQAFIATHSSDIVQGALEAQAPTTIVRVTRDQGSNHLAVLSPDAVKELWSDPLLRYSNVLDGLFHDVVVVCESDADCRYYAAVLDSTTEGPRDDDARVREPQVLFTHCGGKARLSSVICALQAVNVPVVVVTDFDFLRNSADIEKVVRAIGGDFGQLEGDVALVTAALDSDVKPLRRLSVRDEFARRIDELPGELIDQRSAEALRALLRLENGWDKAKRAGLGAVPQGDAYEACSRVLKGLKELGVLVVPVGELERFAPEVPGHGPSWVTEVMERGLHASPAREAIDFVASIRSATRAASGLESIDGTTTRLT